MYVFRLAVAMKIDQPKNNLPDRSLTRRSKCDSSMGNTLAMQRQQVVVLGDENAVVRQRVC